MRLLVQGCLILLLCFTASQSHAATYGPYSTASEAYSECMAFAQHQGMNDKTCPYQGPDSNGYMFVQITPHHLTYKFRIAKGSECEDGFDVDTSDCYIPPPEAVEPTECYENGQLFDNTTGQCVQECPEGELNGVCLQPPAANDNTCNSESPDYQGFIGNGNTKHNICESDMQCEGGSAGLVNGTMACIPDEYGPPSCPSGTTVVIDEYGFVCSTNNDAPEPEPEAPEDPNTDTDGDGQPDIYDPSNDPVSTDKAIDRLKDSVDQGNQNTEGTNQRLDKIGKGIEKSNDLQDEGNGLLKNISDGMEPPEGGFNPDGFGGLVPTFEETGTQFMDSLGSMPEVQALVEFGNVATSTQCPIYTLPATPISSPVVMDVHCSILEQHRPVFAAIFLFFWIGLSLFIFFKA